MCTYTMESVVDPYDNTHVPHESNWLDKCIEAENIFVDYLKSLTFASFNVDVPVESILPEYDGSESGFEALDNLCDVLVSLCDGNLSRGELVEVGSSPQISDLERIKKQDPRHKRTFRCLSSHYGKELQVNANRARSHSSAGVDEILRTQGHLIDIGSSETGRKSRRVSLGMRPKFTNWSKVKGAFKRDKSNTRLDLRDDYADMSYSGDEGAEKGELQFSSSHENLCQLTSSDEDFEYYQDGYSNKSDHSHQLDDSEYRHHPHENLITKSKSAIIQSQSKSCNSPNMNSPLHKNPFKWYRTKSITPSSTENGPQENLSSPPSPYKNSQFLYDEDSITKVIDDQGGNSGNETNSVASSEMLQEVQNKYESLQKRLSREFYEKYHDWRRGRDAAANNDEEEKCIIDFDDPKLSPLFNDQSLSPGFKLKFQEWQKLKGLSLSPTRTKIKTENPNALKKSKSDWHRWRPGSKSESNVLRFLEKEQGESHQEAAEEANFYGDSEDTASYSPLRCKKQTVDILKGKNNRPVEKKELAWLDKELQKVAREKQRLEKEKEKYAERETRLQNMKRAIKSSRKRKQEVLVPTSTGLFRFQGISSKFTRKLYEWEKAKGITAESSTFALLDSYYREPESQRSNKLQNSDTSALLSRSRSVGSVEVAGVGASMMQSATVNHQQSSLSLNDMEQLEEAHLQVENDNLMPSTSQLFEKENDDNEFDLISSELLVIPDYNKNSISHSIPILSSSIKSLQNQDSSLNDLCSPSYSKPSSESKLSECHGSGPRIMFHPIQTDTTYEVSSQEERRDSANADARNIVDQIKKLRAHTSIDDEDRINIVTNLEHLADQLVDMVHNLNNKQHENPDELAIKIADLAVALKRKIKLLTASTIPANELQTNYAVNEKSSSDMQTSGENFELDGFPFSPEDVYTDTEDNGSPTVHCTFTLPSWRVKYTTPSSTESESSNTRNKYLDTRQMKTERRKHFKDDNFSGGDENYDGSDETTLYLDLRSITNKDRRESSDISTSNSESLVSSDIRDKYGKNNSVSPEPIENEDQEVLHCLLTLDGQKGTELKEKYSKERRLNLRNAVEESKSNHSIELTDAEVDKHLNDYDNEDPPFKLDIRSYSPKPISSKRKCSSCGKIKRISKCRKVTSNNYCPCGKKEADKCEQNGAKSEENATGPSAAHEPPAADCSFTKSASYSNTEDLANRKVGRIARSKVYDFNSLKNADKSSTESDISKLDKNSVNVIVPTTRKIFAPLKQDEHGGTSAVVSFTIDDAETVKNEPDANASTSFIAPPWVYDLRSKSASPSVERKDPTSSLANHKKRSILEMHANVDKLPPASPLSAKRVLNKENNNSSIKMMIAHYNKLTSENPEKRPLDSSCWASSLQKSPVLERRNRFEHITESVADSCIRKSKSAVLAVKGQQPRLETNDGGKASLQFGIAKSSSAGSIQYRPPSPPPKVEVEPAKSQPPESESAANVELKPVVIEIVNSSSAPVIRGPELTSEVEYVAPALERNTSFESVLSETKLRSLRLQEAKNRFFNQLPSTAEPARVDEPVSAKSSHAMLVGPMPTQHESKGNAEGESNFSSLNKSVSTGAIDDRTKSCLPACEKSPSKSKFGFSSIASKFRKVKMRRHREPEVSAVSSLCKASLLVNLDKEGKQKEYLNSSKSCPSSPVMQRSISKRNSSSN